MWGSVLNSHLVAVIILEFLKHRELKGFFFFLLCDCPNQIHAVA